MLNKKIKPPALSAGIIRNFSVPYTGLPTAGDLEEEFSQIASESGEQSARWWYRRQVFNSLPFMLRVLLYWSMIMITNYIKIAYRNIVCHKGYSFINISGLAIGMAASILLFLYVQYELSFDKFHTKYDRISRVLLIDKNLGVSNNYAGITFGAMGEALEKDVPEIEKAVRFWNLGRNPIDIDNRRVFSERATYVDPSLFTVFDFELLQGDPETVLTDPGSVVLSRELAHKMYGDNEPMGKSFEVSGNTLTVTGIMEDFPENSHLQYDMIVSNVTTDTTTNLYQGMHTWNRIFSPTYVLLNSPEAEKNLDEKLIEVLHKYGVDGNFASGGNFSMTHQKLEDVHLKSKNIMFQSYNRNQGDITYVYSLSAVAVIVILIAAFNFMNLATARSAGRAREVGMRKVVGAYRNQLVSQFIGESMVLCIISFILAMLIVIGTGAFIHNSYGLDLHLSALMDPVMFFSMFGAALLIGLLAGLYPAFVLSGFRPVRVLRGSFKASSHGVFIRRALVVLQFGISISLIIASGTVFNQMQFVKSTNIGYNREQVLSVRILQEHRESIEPFTNTVMQSTAVETWGGSSNVPGRTFGRTGILPDGRDIEDMWVVSTLSADENFIEALGMEIAEGRFFSQEYGTDTSAVVLNQAAVKALGWEDDPIGKTFNDQDIHVIGVVKDFHFRSLRHKVEPVAFFFNPENNPLVNFKLRAGQVREGIEHINSVWSEMFPETPISSSFLDEEFGEIYSNEENFGSMMRGFTLLAVIVACMGLFGLASHTVQQRTKEIGIRKVLGANLGGLVRQISKEFILLVLVSNVIAWPVAWYAADTWLQNFEYRISIGLEVFVFAAVMAFIIAIVTVSFQSVRAALANPVDSLRHE